MSPTQNLQRLSEMSIEYGEGEETNFVLPGNQENVVL